jgi:hypothetical protein
MSREELEELLEMARETQTAFWKALGALEGALECEISGIQDLELVTIEGLLAADEDLQAEEATEEAH